MPRTARLDAPGVLHHVMIRGIVRRNKFRNNHAFAGFYTLQARILTLPIPLRTDQDDQIQKPTESIRFHAQNFREINKLDISCLKRA